MDCAIVDCPGDGRPRRVAPTPDLTLRVALCDEHWAMVGTQARETVVTYVRVKRVVVERVVKVPVERVRVVEVPVATIVERHLTGPPPPPGRRTCLECKAPLVQPRTGRKRLRCPDCAAVAQRASDARRRAGILTLAPYVCAICGAAIPRRLDHSGPRKYCSPACAAEAKVRSQRLQRGGLRRVTPEQARDLLASPLALSRPIQISRSRPVELCHAAHPQRRVACRLRRGHVIAHRWWRCGEAVQWPASAWEQTGGAGPQAVVS